MSSATSITVRVPLKIRRRPGRKMVVTPGPDCEAPRRIRADPTVTKALARAFRYQKLLDEGRYSSITEMAAAEKIDRGYLGRILLLAQLSPTAIDALLRHSVAEWGLRELGRAAALPWAEQEAALHLRPSEASPRR
jgi:hypothetical protein